MIRVIPLPLQTDLKEPQITRIYKITYADANQVYEALDDLKTGKGEIALIKGTNHIMITDEEAKIKAMDKFIEQVDHLTPQVLVEVRIYDVTTREGFEFDPRWHFGNNADFINDSITGPKEVTETVTGPQSSIYDQTRTDMRWLTARGLKNVPGQGLIPQTGYPDPNEVWAPPGTDVGITPIWERKDRQVFTEPGSKETETKFMDYGSKSGFPGWRRDDFVGASFDRFTGGTLHVSLLNDAIDLNLALTILHSQVDARLLANPRILVIDNETADFEIVRETPYREFQQVGRQDPITYTAFKNIGVDLKVTPHIARDGMLRLHIVPKFSTLVSQVPTGDFSQLPAPIVDSRSVDTKAMIRDGQTIVIGGLRKREISKGISKVPVLSDLPLIGGLFTSESESKVIKELIVFITTTIINEPTLSEREQELLGETAFKMPQIDKTRIEKGEFNSPKADESDITDSLDLLLKKLEPAGNE
jgi:type II secretory pathway component GspD/PulD (secretin)